jgi:hypothetical protein
MERWVHAGHQDVTVVGVEGHPLDPARDAGQFGDRAPAAIRLIKVSCCDPTDGEREAEPL